MILRCKMEVQMTHLVNTCAGLIATMATGKPIFRSGERGVFTATLSEY
jgi:hypothetical protein